MVPDYINPEDGIMLVRKEALIQGLGKLRLNSEGIKAKYWQEKGNIYELIPKENNFKAVKFADLKALEYAAFSYQWVTCWDKLIRYITDPKNLVRCEWLWVDIICLNQNAEDKMKTINISDWIYQCAKEYHIMEVSSLNRGWIVFEISSVPRSMVIKTYMQVLAINFMTKMTQTVLRERWTLLSRARFAKSLTTCSSHTRRINH